jgi:hypothetical protein
MVWPGIRHARLTCCHSLPSCIIQQLELIAACFATSCCAVQVKAVLQQLTAMNPNPTIGLAEAAEMLCKHLGVALVRCA